MDNLDIISIRRLLDADTFFGNWLYMYLLQEVHQRRVDPISLRIVEAVKGPVRLPVALLACLHCRWSELDHINLSELVSGHELLWWQPKTKAHRKGHLNPSSFPDHLPKNRHMANPTRFGYDAVRLSLTRVIPYKLLADLDSRTSSTHIFRHLYATWAAIKGYPMATISEALGHSSPLSAYSYLHLREWRGIFEQ